jgi:hypothetical protein
LRAGTRETNRDTERASKRERERGFKEGGNSDAAILSSLKKKDKLLINYFRLML